MRKQFPLFLAWGVTIHKVQGMTMKEIVVNMDRTLGRFDRGQAYVAFSRVTQFEKLHILNYDRGQIKVDNDVDAEMKRIWCITPTCVFELEKCTWNRTCQHSRTYDQSS